MKIKYVVSVLLIVSIAILVATYFFPSEEKRVKKQFNLLSEWVSKYPDESTIGMALKMQRVGTLFDEQCGVKLPVDSLTGNYTREEISSYAARYRARLSKLSLDFFDLDITFPENGVAKVNLTARLTGQTRAGERMSETREIECVLKKIAKNWLFTNIEVIEVLRK